MTCLEQRSRVNHNFGFNQFRIITGWTNGRSHCGKCSMATWRALALQVDTGSDPLRLGMTSLWSGFHQLLQGVLACTSPVHHCTNKCDRPHKWPVSNGDTYCICTLGYPKPSKSSPESPSGVHSRPLWCHQKHAHKIESSPWINVPKTKVRQVAYLYLV